MVGLLGLLPALGWADLGEPWQTRGGDWAWTRDVHTMALQRAAEGEARAVRSDLDPSRSVWRCTVEPGLGAGQVGFAFRCDEALSRGLVLELAGSEAGGFRLTTAGGDVLWEDRWAPWQAYDAYTLEGVVEGPRVRVQMLDADGRTLLSQSDWLDLPAEAQGPSACVVLRTVNSRARFWGVEADDQPLSPLTDDSPNKRRLWQGPEGEWNVRGPGNWMWTDRTRQRVRQFANVDRAWAIDRTVTGRDRLWQTTARVYPPAGGAGMLVKSDDTGERGLLVWLGGTFGAGCLMVYRVPGEALWASPQDVWHYEEDLILQAETQGAQIRARLLRADGQAVLAESPWLALTDDEGQWEGCTAFHTWIGSAEFWGFREGPAVPALTAQPSTIGPGWMASPGATAGWLGEGQTVLRLAGDDVWCLNEDLKGARGAWRGTVTVGEGTAAAGLLFQAAPDLSAGFRAVLEPGRFSLQDLALGSPTRWEDTASPWQVGRAYVIEAKVMTDRVSVRLLDAQTDDVISESPAVYVSDRNNDREGRLGFWVSGGEAWSQDWAFEAE